MKHFKSNIKNKIPPKKSLGQNFLVDKNAKRKIISACNLKSNDIILEIGPGKGAITEEISPLVKKIFAIEKDKRLLKGLNETFKDTNVSIIGEDILKYDFKSLPNNIKIVGNLPYNIATPIIDKAIKNKEKFNSFYMTVQLEYGERMVAKPNNKKYGPLSCFIQYHADAKMLFKIKNTCFYPKPKVQSCFLKLTFPKETPFKAEDEKLFFDVLKTAFCQRRKTVQNSLSPILDKKILSNLLSKLAINPKLRAENLSIEDYIRIADTIKKL
ncbi:MAG: 16S rRNA (adenine(1518)-N(6)/adenine(1519)-N(6))-dimethyltransferase RsmA [Candidatus Zapsychrus exili]|nr:16S rRNA (adenine(1518)-N(6)/adenine(1519)-N(6))-dimethyltransferase RsmA [Candidatus Zapsychrus exili]